MKLLVAGVASAALLVPAGASARVADSVPVPATARVAPVVTVQSSSPDSGFDWGAAGVGAGAAGGLVLIAAGGFGVAYRARTRRDYAAG
jgi:hypothetical protein